MAYIVVVSATLFAAFILCCLINQISRDSQASGMDSSKRSILVTGCSDGGIGAALALELHRSGKWRVLATARDLNKMQSLSAAGIETLALDVVSEDSLQDAVRQVSKLLDGKLDGLLLNAGGGLSVRYPSTKFEYGILTLVCNL
jgi:1-acylglycerone phosphate reductase